ncbi:MAG: pyridoxal phosphate-dependent aminotransferase [Desulfurococcales archaeon]|nr:pyridoxal phosphate-dependent aminotransferase [Desulfurococcales archaeon]
MSLEELPEFCLERWQSLRETKARILLSESGVEPLTIEALKDMGASLSLEKVVLGYGWTQGSPSLRHAIADFLGGISPENVLVTNGSSEANFLAVMTIVSPGDSVIVDMPNYMQVPGLLAWKRAEIFEAWRIREGQWQLPVGEIIDAVRRIKPRALFITSPNNPTGTIDWEALEAIVAELRNTHTILVVDEVYRGLEIHGDTGKSALKLGIEHGVPVVVTGGLSKVFGLPGLRIGWLASNISGIVEKAWSLKDYTTISPPRLSEVIATEALRDPLRSRLIARAKGIAKRNIEILRELLSGREDLLEPYWPSAGAFLLARLPWAKDTMKLAEGLYEDRGVLVVPGECFDMPGYIRVGLGRENPSVAREEFEELLEGLEKLRGSS